ncbi:hybrid sensor histidine kinase/response regulator [Pseudoduganella violacea]|uniref:histidine kinase n=1 Tax=Pseudoduganella violacea TaxID=1715466 RepID=A0A7W5B9A6_9BURK|nr:response regulator [Pseudoduganella violacea]MBB3118891.1 signal transduction histidine kinase/CheY-like chemotaxis protein [Pseudoduganella violacea]
MERRILIFAPGGRDAELTEQVLAAAQIPCHACSSADELAAALQAGAAGVLAVEEALNTGAFGVLEDFVNRQPPWSDLPILLLTRRGIDSPQARQAVLRLGNLTLLERPVLTLTLVTVLQAQLRARHKQYQVREAEQRKDEFLASLGHELRNPLAPIRTSAALLRRMTPTPPELQHIGTVIERQTGHLTRLVDDLLDVARITSGKVELQYAQLSLASVIAHVEELCTEAAASRRIALAIAQPPQPVLLHADGARLVQLLSNVLSNAIKFTPEGGHIALQATVAGELLQVTVRDNGIGMEAEALERIFNMFEQNKPGSGQLKAGLGIGLSLARQFALLHGGSITASSAGLGLGSEFTIRLPVVLPAQANAKANGQGRPAAASAPQGGDSRRKRVLVVDDNHDAADSLSAMFATLDCEVGTAYDGYAALAAVENDPPDLVVMDLSMPGMDGYEAARLIRQHPVAHDAVLVALSGWGQDDARRRTGKAGFDYHLVKPVAFDTILELAQAEAVPHRH